MTDPAENLARRPLLSVQDLKVEFHPGGRWPLRKEVETLAVDSVSFDLHRGEVFGLAGESGAGKSTLARAILGLVKPGAGSISFDGRCISDQSSDALRDARRRIQIIFQDPGSALSPRRTIAQSLLEPLDHFKLGNKASRPESIVTALETVGLDRSALERYPHQFSSGQRQRIAIARALLPEPDILIADEAVAALDVSVQASVLNLLARLKASKGLTMLFISHDLAVIRQLADTVGVMYGGRMVESARAEQIFKRPGHPYTQELIRSAPDPDRPLHDPGVGVTLAPGISNKGCVYRLYCPRAMDVCRTLPPYSGVLTEAGTHRVECHLHDPDIST